MFLHRLVCTARAVLAPRPIPTTLVRPFSSTPVASAGYKMKSHSGAKKRWRSIASGHIFKRGKAGHSHMNLHKGAGRINRLGNTAYSTAAQTSKLKKKLLPYGSN